MSKKHVPMSVTKSIIVDKDKPFKHCKLDREKYAEVLTNLVETYGDGFVMALSSPWGTGKTTFLEMWQQHLINQDFHVLHFNAWKTDYSSDPFIALISQLKVLSESGSSDAYKGFLKKGATVVKRLLPAITKGAIQRYTDDEELAEAAGIVTEVTAGSLEEQIKQQLETEQSIEDFQNALEELVETSTDDKPLVFIIDELDRCRPNYAVAVLEYIKHFYAVKGIVFVLGIDKEQLGHAVRGVYGSDKIDADEYLRRFIDLEFTLPEPDTMPFCAYLHDRYGLDDFLDMKARTTIRELSAEKEQFVNFTSSFFKQNKPTVRLLQKFYFRISVVMSFFRENQYVFPGLFVYLVYLKLQDEAHYDKIKNKKLTISEVAKHYEKHIDQYKDKLYQEYWTEAQLLVFYRNYLNDGSIGVDNVKPLLTEDEKLNFETTVSNQKWIDKSIIRGIKNLNEDFEVSDFSIEHLISIIDLNSNVRLT